ncbi:MAG: hypothetical protein QOK47_278 [Actinomycetota bacterium]|nr:hypothetical protein [Actinomycetota bacterium]
MEELAVGRPHERAARGNAPARSNTSGELSAARAELRKLFLANVLDVKHQVGAQLQHLDELTAVFSSFGDERSLGRAAYLRANVYWDSFRLAAAESALGEALDHARKSESHHDAQRALESLTAVFLLGPHPVDDAIERCKEILVESDEPLSRSKCLLRLGTLYAMKEDFDTARAHVEEGRSILLDLGHRHAVAASTHESGMVEVLAGRHQEAEREFRDGIETLEIIGDGATLASSAAHLARVLYSRGQLEDALHWTEASEAAWGDHPYGIVEWGPTRAKIQARFGHTEVAEHLARAALQTIQMSDDILARADTAIGLAEVYILGGRYIAATPLLEEAVGLYSSKGVVPFERQTRRLLAATAA